MEAGDLDALRATFEQRAEEIPEPDGAADEVDDEVDDAAATADDVPAEQTP